MASYYQPSGHMPLKTILLAILLSPLTALFGWVYAWLIFHISLAVIFEIPLFARMLHLVNLIVYGGITKFILVLIIIKCILAVGLGLILFLVAFFVIWGGKSRSPRKSTFIGFLLGALGWYCQWSAWLVMMIQAYPNLARTGISATMLDVALHPTYMLSLAYTISQTSLYTSGSLDGFWLWVAWLLEMIVAIGIPTLAVQAIAEAPFCEISKTWADNITLPKRFAFINDVSQFVQSLEARPDKLLTLLQERIDGKASYAILSVYRCKGNRDGYLSVINTTVTVEKEKEQTNNQTIVEHLHLSRTTVAELILHASADNSDTVSSACGEEPAISNVPTEDMR